MKIRLLPLIAAFIAATPLVTSCLDSEEQQIMYEPESSITGFSVGTLHIDRMGKDRNGVDSPYVDTLNLSNYPFTINQINRTIENRDSFPIGTHIDKVVTNITYDSGTGILIYRPKGSSNDTIWSSTDSIDFTEPLQFKVYMYSGSVGRPYKVTLNVHKVEPDTMTWADSDKKFAGGITVYSQKALYADGMIYVFGETGNGESVIQYTTVSKDGTSGEWQPISNGNPGNIMPYSATVWNENIYFLSGTSGGKSLYSLDPQTNTFIKKEQQLDLLVAADNHLKRLYAVDKNKIQGYFDAGMNWNPEKQGIEYGIELPISFYSEPLPYNTDITRTTIMGHSNAGEGATIYQRLSSDTCWNRINQNQPMPNLENITMLHYDGKLYAFGGPRGNSHAAFDYFYSSTDNGLTWWKTTECMYFPTQFESYYTDNDGEYSATVDDNNFIWIVWGNGNISRGRINRLGFDPKWPNNEN